MATEDDTFRYLIRISYAELDMQFDIFVENCSHFSDDTQYNHARNKFFVDRGWTASEYEKMRDYANRR